MKKCAHCKHSISKAYRSAVNNPEVLGADWVQVLFCEFHQRLAILPCDQWERAPGSDDDVGED